jgi:GT2 family glycosyltransferase
VDVVALMTQDLRCAAILPTLGRPELALECLRALVAAQPAFHEIVVADQGHASQLENEVRALGATYLHLPRPGLSHARNAAIAHARSPWLYFPDDDCTVAPTVLAAIGAGLARHPGVVFACAHVTTPEGRAVMVGLDGRERVLMTPADLLRTVFSPGLFARRDALDSVGGFDEQFGLGSTWGSGEESDLLFRLLATGGRGVYVPEARVQHPDPYVIRDADAGIARAESYGRGWGALFAKHAAGPLGPTFRAMHRKYLVRAFGGAALATLTFRSALARRYWASYRGRRAGFLAYQRARSRS